MHIPAVRLGLWCLQYAASVAAPLVVGWAGKSSVVLCSTEGTSRMKSAALCSTEGTSRLLVVAHMWKVWLPHLKGSITAGADRERFSCACLPVS